MTKQIVTFLCSVLDCAVNKFCLNLAWFWEFPIESYESWPRPKRPKPNTRMM